MTLHSKLEKLSSERVKYMLSFQACNTVSKTGVYSAVVYIKLIRE